MNATPDIEALSQYVELGIGLAAVNDYGAYAEKEHKKRFIKDISIIEKMIRGKVFGYKIKRFRFMPSKAGFICFDIDNKNGVNGTELWKGIAAEKGIDLKETFNKTTKVKTPSGWHFYFKSNYTGKLRNLCSGVEIKAGNLNLTAAGSIKDGKPYILQGLLKDALELPADILELAKAQQYQATAHKANYNGTGKKYSLNFLLEETLRQQDGNHNRQVTFAVKYKRFGYTPEQVLDFIYKHPEHFGTGKDTASTVYSIYGLPNPNRGGI